MKRTLAQLMVVGVALLPAAGCIGPGASSSKVPGYVHDAVAMTLNSVFEGPWSGEKVFVAQSSYIPNGLSKAGTAAAEVLDEKALAERFEDSSVAPAMAMIRVFEDSYSLVHVQVTYKPIKMDEYHKPAIDPCFFERVFKRSGDKLILVSSTVAKL